MSLCYIYTNVQARLATIDRYTMIARSNQMHVPYIYVCMMISINTAMYSRSIDDCAQPVAHVHAHACIAGRGGYDTD